MREQFAFILTQIRGAWRFRWHGMAAAWIVCIVGWAAVLSMPNIYEAFAQIYVNPNSPVRDAMKRINVSTGADSNLFVVRQAMLGRPRLEKVAEETGLILRAEDAMERERMFIDLKEQLVIESGRSREGANLYTIAYQDRSPVMAKSVVETLLDQFVNDMLSRKGEGTGNAQQFYEENLEYYSQQLADDEMRLAEFKKKYVGLLPGDSGGIFEKLQMQMDILGGLRKELSNELVKRNELQRQLRGENPYSESSTASAVSGVPSDPTEARIKELNSRLDTLLLTFTDKHPDVVAIRQQIEQLQTQRREELAQLAAAGGLEGVSNSTNPVYQNTQIALNNTNVRIASLESQIRQNEELEERLRQQVDTIPEIEAEYSRLMRGYDQTKQLYNDLKLEAERLRLTRAGSENDQVDFEITEPPVVGAEPVAPRRGLFMMAVLVLAMGAGGAFSFVLHQINPVFNDAQTLKRMIGRPVLGVISMTLSRARENQIRRELMMYSITGVGLLLLFVGSVIFMNEGVELMRTLTFKQSS